MGNRMMRKAIHQIAAEILAEHKRPMSVDEIYEVIVSRGLYEFKAKSPKSVLRTQMRRHAIVDTEGQANSSALFRVASDGRFSVV
jgi:HB1, ASXL, restriction endonuclease HTH domain